MFSFYFTWYGKPDKVKRPVLINDINTTGLKAIHVKSFINSFKCKWIWSYCYNSKGSWKTFFDFNLAKYGKDVLFHCNCAALDIRITNLFVRQVVRSWCDATYSTPTIAQLILSVN